MQNPSNRKSSPYKPTHKAKHKITLKRKKEILEATDTELPRFLSILKRKRTELGYSQDEVADFLDISWDAYKKIEYGKSNNFRVIDLIKLLMLFEIDYV